MAIALKNHERANAFNLVFKYFSASNLRGRSADRHQILTRLMVTLIYKIVRNLGALSIVRKISDLIGCRAATINRLKSINRLLN